MSEKYIVKCLSWKARNAIPTGKLGAVCGRCKKALTTTYKKTSDFTPSHAPHQKKKRRPLWFIIKLSIMLTIVYFSTQLYLANGQPSPAVTACLTADFNNCPAQEQLIDGIQSIKTFLTDDPLTDNFESAFSDLPLWERQRLQFTLKKDGRYNGLLDGVWGKKTQQGLVLAMHNSPLKTKPESLLGQ